MLTQLLAWLMKSKGAKVGASAAGGTGVIALILGLHADVTGKIEKQDSRQKEYVQLVLQPLKTEIQHLQKESNETKQMVRDIHSHLLKNKTK